jgi:hypothetical protein
MPIKEYVGHILSSISANPYVESQSISCQERPPDAIYLSGLVAFIDGSQLHIKEFILFASAGARIVKYGYNYLDKDGNLVFRYDNALDPMARDLSSYPEHRHAADGLSSAKRPLFEEVLDEISDQVRQRIRA